VPLPNESSPHPPILFKIHFNIMLIATPKCLKQFDMEMKPTNSNTHFMLYHIISYHIISYIISCHIIIISYHIIILYCQGLPKITVRSTICTVALPTKTLHFSVPSPALPPPPQPSLPCFERPTNYVAISRLLKVRNTGNKLSATRTAVYCRRTAALPTPCSSKTHFLSVHRGLFHLP